MKAFFHALAFMTRFPVPRLSDSKEDWLASPAYYPLVGAVIGVYIWAMAWIAGNLFFYPLEAVTTLVCWIFITGGLHLDGWMDVADGLGSYRPKEEMLIIMKDSRVGAMGVIAAILLILSKTAALYEIFRFHPLIVLILPPIIARLCLVLAIWFWPYISTKGIGTGMKSGLNIWRITAGLVFCLTLGFIIGGVKALFTILLTGISGFAFVCYLTKRLGGLTGDCYGALVEWTETAALLFILLLGRWFT